jgi:hypothetical protein
LEIAVLAFIYSISLYCMVWPSILPFTSLIAIFLNTFTIILALLKNNRNKLKFGRNKLLILFVYVSITLCILIFSALKASSASGLIVKFYIFLSFILLILTLTQEGIKLLCRAYVIYIVIISTLGIVAFVLINFQYVPIGDFPINMTEITSGKIPRTQDNLRHDYDAPYYMALVYTLGIQKVNIIYLLFYPSTGWSHEPQIAAFISTPALILLSFKSNYYFRTWFRTYGCCTIIIFLVSCFSLSNFIALFACYIFHLVRSLGFANIKVFSLTKKLVGMGLVLFLVLTAIRTPHILKKFSNSVSLENALSQLSFSKTPLGLDWLLELSAICFLFFIIILVLKLQYEGILKKSISLILVYFTIHSLKGSIDTTSQYMLFVFFVINGIQNLIAGTRARDQTKVNEKEYKLSVV